MSARARPPRPRRRRRSPRRASPGCAIRRLAIVDPAGGEQPIAQRGRRGARRSSTASSTTTARCAARLERRGHTLPHRLRHRGARAPLRGARPGVRRGPARHVRARAVGRARAAARARARPVRDQAARLRAGSGGGSAFASELKALLALPDFPREIDPAAVETYLALNAVPAPRTIFRAARKLPPGHRLIADARAACGSSATRGRARRRLASCAASRSPRSPPRRASGSRTPCARTWPPTCRSASCSPAASTPASSPRSRRARRRAAADVQRRLRRGGVRRAGGARARSPSATAPSTTSCGSGPRRRATLAGVAASFDEPSGDATALPYWLLARFAAEHVKAVLTGEGADELFGGYQTYVADRLGPAGRAARRGARARGRRAGRAPRGA